VNIIVTLKSGLEVHSRSFKLVPFKSLGMVSYSPSIITMAISFAVCDIFGVKELRDVENWVRGHSRSLKMAPFDRPYMTFYRSALVTIVLSCTILSSLTLNYKTQKKVIETSTIRKLWCSFLFAFHSKYGAILYCLRDIEIYWWKIAKFLYTTCI